MTQKYSVLLLLKANALHGVQHRQYYSIERKRKNSTVLSAFVS